MELALSLQDGLIARATGDAFPGGENAYRAMRKRFMSDSTTRALLPEFVIQCRTLDQYWAFIRDKFARYQERREYLWEAFAGLLEHLEVAEQRGRHAHEVAQVLREFDLEHVQAAWDKALERRHSDPEGAITAAKSLLEDVLKHILDACGVDPGKNPDLPKLWHLAAEQLHLAPKQHMEKAFKTILGSSQSVVNQIAHIRDKLGDAHGKGPRRVRPSPRHAALVVNLAGTMAAFVTETWVARSSPPQDGREVSEG